MADQTENRARHMPGASQIIFVLCIICIWELIRSRSVLVAYNCNASIHQTNIDMSDVLSTLNYRKYRDSLVKSNYTKYEPCIIEDYVMKNAVKLGYASEENPSGCQILFEENATTPQIHSRLLAYEKEIQNYAQAIKNFAPIPDLLKSIQATGDHDVCSKARLHPDGIHALFPSQQLSYSASGFVEPLLPPMRSLEVCKNDSLYMSMDYLVHDFEFMCQQLKPTSKRILIDMGAALQFHGNNAKPILKLLDLYEKFGFHFDHIYGFEITPVKPHDLYQKLLPEKYFPSYHLINVGVESDPQSRLNPLHSLVESLDEDDFIVVKLDIDTASIEVPLAYQLLEDLEEKYSKRIDHFYFEHHVHLLELAHRWKETMNGTIKESLDLFYGLRQKGIATHFWP